MYLSHMEKSVRRSFVTSQQADLTSRAPEILHIYTRSYLKAFRSFRKKRKGGQKMPSSPLGGLHASDSVNVG